MYITVFSISSEFRKNKTNKLQILFQFRFVDLPSKNETKDEIDYHLFINFKR